MFKKKKENLKKNEFFLEIFRNILIEMEILIGMC
jgi:hypothetical protein